MDQLVLYIFYEEFLMKYYHVSTLGGLNVLEPRVSTHGKAYVYATSNLELSLLFGSKKSYGDFDGIYGTKNGKPFFYEAYVGAFKRRFENESCYIYEVPIENFEHGKTNFKAEVVSEKPVKVLSCTKVDDLHKFLLRLVSENKIELKEFQDTKAYKDMINHHISDRLIRYDTLQKCSSHFYKFLKEKFPSVVKKIENTI